MTIHEITGLTPSSTGEEAPKTTLASTIYTYATSFFKSLNERAESFVRSLAGRVTDFFKDLRAMFEVDSNVVDLRDYFQGLLNKPLDKEKPTDTLETRLASLEQFINNETLKANRALANLFYRTRAELLSRILGENKTEILAITVAASEGLAVADEGENDQIVAGTQQAIETPQEIIANDIEQLKARTTAQKVWDFACSCTFGSNAKKSISLHQKNQANLEENHRNLILNKHAEIIKAFDICGELKAEDLENHLKTLESEIIEFNNSMDKFVLLCEKKPKKAVLLKEACSKAIGTKISHVNFYYFAQNKQWNRSEILMTFLRNIQGNTEK